MHEPTHLKNAGLKSTLPRIKVLSLFKTSKERHLSAEEVYKLLLVSGDDVGLATVYRVLTQFEQADCWHATTLRTANLYSSLIRASTTTTSCACNAVTSKSFTMRLSKLTRKKPPPSAALLSTTTRFTSMQIAQNLNVRIKTKGRGIEHVNCPAFLSDSEWLLLGNLYDRFGHITDSRTKYLQ